MTEADLSMLRGLDNKCLRRILGIYWTKKTSSKEIEKTTCIPQIDRELKKRRWTWIGHVLRMNSDANPKIALTWTPEGKRKRGRLRETWRRTAIKEREAMGWRSSVEPSREQSQKQSGMESRRCGLVFPRAR